MTGRESFASRWSRLKQEGEPPAPEPDAKPLEPVEDDRTDEEILTELGLPHPEELQPGDDVTGFMAKTVPDRLRRMALRRLWRSNPVLANVDGLVEYGEDYTDSATVVENLQTLYQVGKGMFVEPAEEDEPAEMIAESETIETEETEPEEVVEVVESQPQSAEIEPEPTPAPIATRRRMSFS